MTKGENIVEWIKGQSTSWVGHLKRMKEDRMSKKIFTQKLEGTRRRGKPRKIWKLEVERDLQVLGVSRRRELVADRKMFRRIYGPKYENREWKSWTNRELEKMSEGQNIVKWIKGQKIS